MILGRLDQGAKRWRPVHSPAGEASVTQSDQVPGRKPLRGRHLLELQNERVVGAGRHLGRLFGEVPQSVLFIGKPGEIVCEGGEDNFLYVDVSSACGVILHGFGHALRRPTAHMLLVGWAFNAPWRP